ncbi:MAG: carbamoyltransferase HypF, partial [Actinobacteria bacterium]|nr:carbamoyltransferase HypF [Actinomycetota bacterium]
MKKTINSNLKTYILNIKGIVQGVGFRPFIWHTAKKLGLNGIVTNTTEGVFVKINASSDTELLNFIRLIEKHKPAPSVIEKIEYEEIGYEDFNDSDDFIITKSIETSEKFQLISPDLATCSSCVYDINDNKNLRRFNYPFTNCTNCGPRFTIIKRMPYDRINTTMAEFKQCPGCQDEYDNPLDRRFH